MTASRNTKIGALAIAAVALIAAGGAFAAGRHHGSKAAATSGLTPGSYATVPGGRPAQGGGGFGLGPGGDLAAAATYLGLSESTLETDLQSGKTLAQIADSTSGKSSSGLIAALVTAEKTRLAAAVKAGTLTQAQADQASANLTARITARVNGTMPSRGGFGGPGFGRGFGRSDDLAAAATYLGLSQSDLQTKLQSGKTLAQVANSTSGKSSSGLIDALVKAEQAKLQAAVTAGTLTQAQADQLSANLKTRITNLVNGTLPARGGFGGPGGYGYGYGGGGSPPSGSTFQPTPATHI